MQQSTPPLAVEIIERELKERTGRLVFSDCGLTEIPLEVFNMDWLTELVVTNGHELSPNRGFKKSTSDFEEPNHLTYIPEQIAQLKGLKRLHLGPSGTSPWTIADIGVLSALQELEELNLSNNQIIDISPLKGLVNLTSLNLALNEIKNIQSSRRFGQSQKFRTFLQPNTRYFCTGKINRIRNISLGKQPGF